MTYFRSGIRKVQNEISIASFPGQKIEKTSKNDKCQFKEIFTIQNI